MSIKILTKKSFSSLFWTQFLGAYNDNLFKSILVLVIAYSGASFWGLSSQDLVPLAGGLFILPFFLFSPVAGQISDKIDKAKLIRATKIWEIFVMIIATLGFLFDQYSLLMIVLFFMGTQSAFFGPAKYSILPEVLESEELVSGNAYVELGTFLAILIGTVAAGLVVSNKLSAIWIGAALVAVSALGYLFSLGIKSKGPATPELKINWNPFTAMAPIIRIAHKEKAVWNSILGISWFWFFGAAVLSILPSYGKDFLFCNENVTTVFLASFTFGIGIGSILCEKISFGRVELGVVPIGTLGLSVFLVDLAFIYPNWSAPATGLLTIESFLQTEYGWRILIDFFLVSLFGGVFIVPLYALIQERSDEKVRSQVIAGNNIINALFMVVSAIALIIFNNIGMDIPQIFLTLAILNLLVSIYIYTLVPEFTLRFFAWILVHILYRLRAKGLKNVPETGAAVIACNHITFIDWMILSGAIRRPTRFVMYYKFAEIPLLRYLMKQAKVIPIAGRKENEEVYNQAFATIEERLKDGDLVIIFPEGKLTNDGEVSTFRPGLLKILENNPVPVVPAALSGLWPSLFSRNPNKKFPGQFWKRIDLQLAEPIPGQGLRMDKLQAVIEKMRKRP